MSPLFRGTRRSQIPSEATASISTGSGERLLTHGVVRDGGWVVASNHRLYAVAADGEVEFARPWHQVDAGTWDQDSGVLGVTWVGPDEDSSWTLEEGSMVPEMLRERVQASVVIAERVPLPGKAVARAVIRQNLATSDLVPQVILGRGVRSSDPVVAESARATLDYLKEQVGRR